MGIHYYKGVTIANCKLLQWRFDRLNDHRSSLPVIENIYKIVVSFYLRHSVAFTKCADKFFPVFSSTS